MAVAAAALHESGGPTTLTVGAVPDGQFLKRSGSTIVGDPGGGGAPTGADYLVKTADAGLSAERVVTDTPTVTWDWATGGQAKAAVPDASTTAKGVVELATSAETTAGLAVQASDTRLSNARTPTAHAASHQPGASDTILGVHRSQAISYISGTGTAGADATAQAVKTVVLPANTLTQLGDRIRIRVYWRGDTGAAITALLTVNGVAGSNTTDLGTATLQLNEVWLHYIDSTHANVFEQELGAVGSLSAINVAGFAWTSAQNITVSQDNAVANHIIVFALVVDVLPLGVV